MARLGLSPYSNPIEAGIDSYSKLSQVFRQNDQAEMDRQKNERDMQDSDQRRQLTGMQMQREQGLLDEQVANAPVRATKRQADLIEARHKVLHGPVAAGMMENELALKEGRQPVYSPETIDAVLQLNKEAPLFDDDPNEAVKQTAALHNIQATMGQITPALQQHMSALPEGQRKVRVNDSNAPGLTESFNVAFKKLLGGKEAESFLIDGDKGVVIPIIPGEGADGKMSPLTKKGDDGTDQVHAIPMQLLNQYISKGAAFGNLLLPALAQTEGNDTLLAQVMKAGETRKENTGIANAQAAYQKWEAKDGSDATLSQKQSKLSELMSGENIKPELVEKYTAKLKKETDKPTGNIVADPKSPTGFSFLTENGNLMQGAQDPEAKDKRAEKRQMEREDRVDARLERREDRRDARTEKKESTTKRKDALIKEKLAILNKDPEWMGKEFAERQAEATAQAEAQIEGKPAPKAAGGGNVKQLSDWMKGLEPEGMISGTKMDETVKGAVEQGHSPSDLKAAANALPAKNEQDKKRKQQLLDAITAQETGGRSLPARNQGGMAQAANAKPSSAAKAKQAEDMPPPASYSGKILNDKQTGKRYKSDGKKWNEIS